MRKKHPEHVNLERWLVSYADFITLLFAFFVIMYAISQADAAKFKKVAASIKAAFDSAGPAGMIDLNGAAGGNTANPMQTEEVPGGRMLNLPAGKTHTAADPDPELRDVKELLEETISLELGVTDVSEKLQMQFDNRGLIVRVAVKDFFEPGSAEVKDDLRPILERIGRVLAGTKRLIRLEGHTDPSEGKALADSKSPRFASDWELSAARAAWVAKYWVRRFGFDPKRLGAAGYSHYRPLSAGTGAWDQAKNRRVEIIVLNTEFQQP